MILKEIISILLLLGSLEIFAFDKRDKRSEINNHELHSRPINHFQNVDKEHERKFEGAAQQFEKDYEKWGNQKHVKFDSKEFGYNSEKVNVKLNEIDSKEYADSSNKYGKAFNPDHVANKKFNSVYNKKRISENKHPEEHEKPEILLPDINVNHIKNNKEISRDSQLIFEPGSLLHDVNVNYIKNNKEISRDSELIFEPGSLLHDVNVNYIKNNNEGSGDIDSTFENVAPKNKENYEENYQNGNELYMKRFKKKFYENLMKINFTNPPSPNDTVLMARYIVHIVDWAALATLSGRSGTKGSPFICVKATSDGMRNMSSGIPFFYMSPRDLCTQDLQKDNRVSVLVTLSETEYCKNQNLDPQDPRCAKLTLSGKIKRIKHGSDEEKYAKKALFSRHPAMESWPADHNWYFSKLKIGQIILLDQFGGATYIKVKDYLNGKVVEPTDKK